MFLLHSIDDQVFDRNTLLAEQFQVSLRFPHAHRLRYRHSNKAGQSLSTKQSPPSFNSFIQVMKKNIDLIHGDTSASKVSDDITMLLAYSIQRCYHPLENFRQPQQARRMARGSSINNNPGVLSR